MQKTTLWKAVKTVGTASVTVIMAVIEVAKEILKEKKNM